MLLYDNSWAPNPRRVRIFLAEKGVTLPMQQVDLRNAEHRREAFTTINPLQRVPALELDDGAILTESVAICRYIEALHPEPALFGTDAREQAFVEMWNRRLELNFYNAIGAVFRHLHPAMAASEQPQVPAWGEANKFKTLEFLDVFDRHLASSEFAAGDRFSIADITGHVAMAFMKPAKMPLPDHIAHVHRWHAQIAARPSMAA
jgi:glutathione S-transferase